jgi:hypothetical protein
MPPPTKEQIEASERLMLACKKAREAYEEMSPVDRAIHDVRQRESFVRAEIGISHPELAKDYLAHFFKNDFASVLANEVERLRVENAQLRERPYEGRNPRGGSHEVPR